MNRVGIDLGGTKIEGVVLEPGGAEVARHRIDTPAGYEQAIDAIRTLVSRLDPSGQLPVGIGTPGTPSRLSGLMKNCNSTCLNGQPLQTDLQTALGRRIALANDANCLALSEWTDGAAAGADVVFAVILGTGVGGGLLVNGRLVEGAGGVGGEWGHIALPCPSGDELPAPVCYCGRGGCMECWCSGPAMAADHLRTTGHTLSPPDIVEQARSGDGSAHATIEQWLDRLARGLSVVCNIVDPDVIVIGGGLSKIDVIYKELPGRLQAHVFSDEVVVRIVPAMHGDASGVRGAARLND
ncbi:MAG: ROK family protein [Phycisphaerales bacterium]|nr:ROK family protein [Phycisphaerales bacterium]